MATAVVRHVHAHPPRYIATLSPKPTPFLKPTLLLPADLSIHHQRYDATETASFEIGCPCGNPLLVLLGFWKADSGDRILVGPLRVECPKCGANSELFDTREHGYDGEQGVNTHMVGEGRPERFRCPGCNGEAMKLIANFSYGGSDGLSAELQARVQDYFDTFDLVGSCDKCFAIVEITSFECA